MNYFATVLINEIKRIKNKIVLLIIIFSILILSIFTAYTVANESLGENSLRLNVIVVNLDSQPETQLVLNMLLENEYMQNTFNVDYAESEDEATALVKEGKAAAAAIFPNGFLTGVLTGINPSPTIYISNSTAIEQFLITNFSSNLSDVMVNLQSAVYTVLDRAAELGYYNSSSVLSINLEYVNTYLSRASVFNIENIDFTDSVSLNEFYTISLSVFLLFLSSALFFRELNFNCSHSIYKFISSCGKSCLSLYFTKVGLIYLLYVLIFIVLFSLNNFAFSFISIIYLLNACLFFMLIQCLIFNISKNQIATVQINLLLHSLFFIISGGLIPIDFMPSFISKISVISPHLHIRNAMSFGFSNSYHHPLTSLIILILNIILLASCIALFNKKMEADYKNENF